MRSITIEWEGSGHKALPLGQCNRAVAFVGLAIDELAFLVEPQGGEANWYWPLAWNEVNFGKAFFARTAAWLARIFTKTNVCFRMVADPACQPSLVGIAPPEHSRPDATNGSNGTTTDGSRETAA